MTEELNIKALFVDIIHFFRRNRYRLIIFMVSGIISVILFQNIKPKYYNTQAICTSYISEYERANTYRELKQRTAVDLINHLQINIANKDFEQLSEVLGVSIEVAKSIRYIDAVLLYQKTMDEEHLLTNKFEINMVVYDNNIIAQLEDALKYYFLNNEYVSKHYDLFKESNKTVINEIDKEISRLIEIRNLGSKTGMSAVNVTSQKQKVQNQIIGLIEFKEKLKVQHNLGEPLVFVQNFAKVQKSEDDILIWSLLGGLVAIILGVIISLIKEVK